MWLVILGWIGSATDCDILILGGTLAALGAAIEAPLSKKICLV